MKKTKIILYEEDKKKQVCGAACFMAAEIKFSEDVRPASRVRSISPTFLVGSISYLYIISSNFRWCAACKVTCKFQNLNFWHSLKICNFDFVLFWLGIWCESLVWVIMGGGISECRRSSCFRSYKSFPQPKYTLLTGCATGLILGLHPANKRRRYFVTTSLIGWARTLNQPCAICCEIVYKYAI